MTQHNKKIDRRIKRSRKLMQDALLILLKKIEYRQISISEITYQADVARTTFYSHFKTKDELLMSYIDDIFETFFDKLREQFTPDEQVDSSHEIPQILCVEWKKNKAALDLIRSANIDFMIYQRIKENHQRGFQGSPIYSLGNSSNNVLDQYIISSISAATYGVLMQWTDNNMLESCEEVAKILNHFINLESFSQLRDKLKTEMRATM
jgi:AcrR family transcriptional regulator